MLSPLPSHCHPLYPPIAIPSTPLLSPLTSIATTFTLPFPPLTRPLLRHITPSEDTGARKSTNKDGQERWTNTERLSEQGNKKREGEEEKRASHV